jgi:hypothetical protein
MRPCRAVVAKRTATDSRSGQHRVDRRAVVAMRGEQPRRTAAHRIRGGAGDFFLKLAAAPPSQEQPQRHGSQPASQPASHGPTITSGCLILAGTFRGTWPSQLTRTRNIVMSLCRRHPDDPVMAARASRQSSVERRFRRRGRAGGLRGRLRPGRSDVIGPDQPCCAGRAAASYPAAASPSRITGPGSSPAPISVVAPRVS